MPSSTVSPRHETIADLLDQLGGISPARVRANPPPGKATERHLLSLISRSGKLYELVDGALVEKIMGLPESALTCDVIFFLKQFLAQFDLGFLTGPDGAMRLMPKLIRLPDISFVSWKQLGKRERPTDPIADLAPILAIEVISAGNTKKELARKRKEYFLAGTQLVWQIDPRPRTVQVFTAPDQSRTLTEDEILDGGDVLPGLALPVRQIFAEVPAVPKRPRKKRS